MVPIANRVEVALMSSQMFGIAVMVAAAILAWANRSALRDAAADSDRAWRILARIGGALATVTLVWVTLFDRWPQIVAEPYRLSRRWESQRVVFDPVAPEVRLVTSVLIGALLIAGAALFARHIGGYLMQFGLLILGAAVWIPLFIIQQRADVMVIDGVSASEHWGEFAGVGAFWLLRTALGVAIVAATLLIGLMLTAPVVTLALDLADWRFPRATAEADPFFQQLQHHAREHEDVPLRDRWRPIRQPS